MNFKGNLLIGFGVSLVILFISSAASYISIHNLLNSAQLVRETNSVILETEQLYASLKEAESSQRGFLLTDDPAFLEHYEFAKESVRNGLASMLQLTDAAVQQQAIEKLQALVSNRLVVLDEVIAIEERSGVLSIAKLNEGKDYMDASRALINAIRERGVEALEERTGKMNTFATFTPLIILIAALFALTITTIFYIRIKNDLAQRLKLQRELQDKDREISRRIDIIRGIADQVSLGDYTIRINDQQSDALGNVAGSLNKMAASLESSFGLLSEKEWLQAGMAALNDVIIGEMSVTKLSQNVVNFVCNYIHGHAGALYILDQDRARFEAGFAYIAGNNRDYFKIGEGLVGQAIASGKFMEIQGIASENIRIQLSAGEASPKHVVVIPIFDGLTIKGGIEIASLSTFTALEIEFLKNCSHNIGIALSTAQNRRKLQELLEETQSQSEELQAQHSELENINSELEMQSEKLQASEEELRAQQEELRQANDELEERAMLLEQRNQLISEHNLEIKRKAEELAQSARYKSEFLANMSHELRTPLNSILLLSRLMAENIQSNLTPDQIEYARVIEVSGKGLLVLIDEILDLSKIESGKTELDICPVAIAGIVDEMKALFGPVANDKGLKFNVSIADNAPEKIETDRLRLEQIIRNLLSNAFKFTAEGYVGIHVASHKNNPAVLTFTVKDSGIGIPSEKHQLIFEAFQQADGSTQRKYGGTGLGLSISRELVKLLGGEILLNSAPGEGSEFTVCVPLSCGAMSNAASLADGASENSRTEVRGAASEKYISKRIPDSVSDDRENIDATDKIILIIEDDTLFAQSLLEYTRSCGYKGLVAVRGDEGIELAQQYLPMGILLDIQLPIKSGWEVMAELKSDPKTRHIPVHIMSSFEVKRESLLQGAVDFIDKPIAFDQMQDIFQKIDYVLTHHPKKVLIVEENSKHADALAHFLQTFDVRVDVKDKVNEAIDSLQHDQVDCVVLDMGVPHKVSYDTLEEIKNTPGLEGLPIIVFTGTSLSRREEVRIKEYADSIVLKTAHSFQRVLDEVSLFLHLVEKNENRDSPKSRYSKLGALDEVLKGKTVLIADDDVRNIFSLTKAMERYDINVISAIDGNDALKQLAKNPEVDVVLMDMMMPDMDGYQSTAAIRQNEKFKNIPVIAVTAKAMVGDREKCINAGASDYITKPVDIDQLLSLLRVWLYERD
jgi:signal transduction histidine kinase/DNA-binding response OmpR family regulator/CHASE3 domain sensor protein